MGTIELPLACDFFELNMFHIAYNRKKCCKKNRLLFSMVHAEQEGEIKG